MYYNIHSRLGVPFHADSSSSRPTLSQLSWKPKQSKPIRAIFRRQTGPRDCPRSFAHALNHRSFRYRDLAKNEFDGDITLKYGNMRSLETL